MQPRTAAASLATGKPTVNPICQPRASIPRPASSRRGAPRALLALVLGTVLAAAPAAVASSARECLDQASAATAAIELGGDQSAARRDVAIALSQLDAKAALQLAAGVRRPSDAARALGAIAAALRQSDRAGAIQAAGTGLRLLRRIAQPARRDLEQRLLLGEVAALGKDIPLTDVELAPEAARLAILRGLAERDAAAAIGLLKEWQVTGPGADRVWATLALRMAAASPDQALEAATHVSSDPLRGRMLWQLAEQMAPEEAYGVAQRVDDPVVKSGIVAGAAVRLAASDPARALEMAQEVVVAGESARAQLAVALVGQDDGRAVELARGLGERARAWALRRMAVELAPARPERAAALLSEAGPDAETARLVLGPLARVDPGRALEVARGLPEGPVREAGWAAVVAALGATDPVRARPLVFELRDPGLRGQVAGQVAKELAASDLDAATSLLGLVAEPEEALRLRAQVAARAAARQGAAAGRLLGTLPASRHRAEAALEAGRAALATGRQVGQALALAETGLSRDLALRWLLPGLAYSQTASATQAAELISSAYLRSLALCDVARELLRLRAAARPAPERARMVRPIVEWEMM